MSTEAHLPELDGAPLFLLDELPEGLTEGGELLVAGPEGRHAVDVLRLAPGERVRVGDGRGTVAEGEVAAAGPEGLRVRVQARLEVPAPEPRLVLVQALPKGDRGPLAVELATELGVDRIVPWAASRCVTRWRDDRIAKGVAKWRSAAHAASKQSRRARIPEVADLASTRDVCGELAEADLGIVLHEQARARISDVQVPAQGTVAIVVGPEGGLTDGEVLAFRAAGAEPARLGPEVLRTSTAGAAALAAVSLRTRWA